MHKCRCKCKCNNPFLCLSLPLRTIKSRNRIFSFLVLLFLFIPTTSSTRTLSTTEELANYNITFGKTFPRHGLKLLYWFIDHVEIDQNNVINLGDIDPSRCDYGFHKFENVEKKFPSDYGSYYIVGNLNPKACAGQFPDYVTADFYNTRNNPNRNRDRIVVQTNMIAPSRVNRVYITQQYLNTSNYDEDNTYEISPKLLRKIKSITEEFRTPDEFLRQAGYCFNSKNEFIASKFHCIWDSFSMADPRQEIPKCDTCCVMKLEVTSSDTGNARITWSGIPKTILNNILMLKLYGNMSSSRALYSSRVGHQQTGSQDTSAHLDGGLQVRLMEADRCDKEIWASQEYDEANKQLPTLVSGYNASLGLFVKQGKATVRLYINELFTDWKDKFSNSWVGFYGNQFDGHKNYINYQWVTYLEKNIIGYEFRSHLFLHPGVQVRFFLHKGYSCVLAYTVPWSVEASETNEVYETDVSGYDATLQLIVKECKVGARLHISRHFTNWKMDFYNSWVGFYRSSNDHNNKYETWQWVTKFQMNQETYDYVSNMDIGPGVEIRFFFN